MRLLRKGGAVMRDDVAERLREAERNLRDNEDALAAIEMAISRLRCRR